MLFPRVQCCQSHGRVGRRAPPRVAGRDSPGALLAHSWAHAPPPQKKTSMQLLPNHSGGAGERGGRGGGGGWGGSAVLDQKQPPHYRPAPNTVFLSWAQRCGARAGLMRARHDGKCVCERSGCAQTAPVPMIPSDVTQFACFLEPRPYSSDQCKTCTWDTQPCDLHVTCVHVQIGIVFLLLPNLYVSQFAIRTLGVLLGCIKKQ